MKNMLLLVVCLLLVSCADVELNKTNKAPYYDKPKNLFSFAILQDGKIIEPNNGVIKLKNKKFAILFKLDKSKTIYANFSLSNRLYDLVRTNEDFKNVLGFRGTGMAEANGNSFKNIYLSDNGWHVWPVGDQKYYRFDLCYEKNNVVFCKRTVDEVYDIKARATMPFSELHTIYCVYCDVNYLGNYEYKVIDSDYIRIDFEGI